MKLIDQLLESFSFYSDEPKKREFAFVRLVSMVGMVAAPLVMLLTIDRFDAFDKVITSAITGLMAMVFLLNRFVESFRKVAVYFVYSLLYLIVLYLLVNAHRWQYSNNSAFLLTLGFFIALLLMRKQRQAMVFSLVYLGALLTSLFVVDDPLVSRGFLISFNLCYVFISMMVMSYRIRLRDRLHAEQDFLKTLFNNSFDAVFLIEYYSNKIEDCNAVALRMFDLPDKAAVQGKPRGIFRKEAFTPDVEREMKLEISRNGQYRTEIQYVTTKGREFWADLIVYPLTIRNTQYWVYRIVDITERKKALEMVLQREQEYTSLIRNMGEGVMRFDANHHITYANDRMSLILGSSVDDIVGKPVQELFMHPDSDTEYLAEKFEKQRAGISTSCDLPVHGPNQKTIWIEANTTALRTDDGSISGYLCFVGEITERIQQQEALASSEAGFRSLAENAPALIFKIDEQGLVQYVNWVPDEYNIDDIIGAPLTQFMDEPFRSLYIDNLDFVLRTGKSLDFELKASGLQGKMVWYSMRLARVAEQGKHHVIAIVSDIHRFKRIQEALSISEDTYREIFDTTSDLIYIHNKAGVILDVNQTVLDTYDYSRESIIGARPFDFADPDAHAPEDLKAHLKAAWKGKPQNFTFYHKHRESGKIFVRDVMLRKGYYFGEAVLIASVRDITERIKSEERLRNSEEKFRLLFSKANDAIFILEKGILVECNERAYEVFKARPEDFLGKSPAVLFPEKQPNGRNSLEFSEEMIQKTLDGDTQHFPWTHKRMDGSTFQTEVSLSTFRAGNRTYLQGIVRDVSIRIEAEREQIRAELAEATAMELQKQIREREKAEAKLIEEQRFARSIINSSLDMIVAADQNGNITEFNKAAQESFGYSLEEVLGKPVQRLYAVKDERSEVFRRLLRDTGTYTGEIVNRRSDGELFPCYISASILRREDGEIIGSMGVSRDITELKTQQEELRMSEHRYRALYNQAYIGIARMSIDGKFVQANQRLCDILGYNEAELLNLTLTDITHPDYIRKTANFKRHFGKSEDDVDKITFEKKFIHKDGSEIDANLTIASVVDVNGMPDYFVTVFEDITERKHAEEEVKASLLEKEVLLKEVHHRVKNNLQVISSILNLQSSYVKDEKTLEILHESQNRIKSMSFIHENLYQTSDLSEIDFSDYVVNLSTNLLHSYQLRQNRVKLRQDVAEVMLNLDQAIPCGLILNEIVTNAFKYAFPDDREGEVYISLSEDDGLITLTMADNGIGLPEGFNHEESETLGLQLVTILTDQLSATLETERTGGTTYRLSFRKVSRNFKTGKFIEHGKS